MVFDLRFFQFVVFIKDEEKLQQCVYIYVFMYIYVYAYVYIYTYTCMYMYNDLFFNDF